MDNARPHRKLLRSPSLKRRSKVLPVHQRVQLQRVLGVTVSSNAGLSCDSNSGTIAYPAGCAVVLFNTRRNKQSHILNATKKPVTCLAFSRDGKYLITGETGHQPAVRIWDVQGKLQVAEFRGHKFGISCVAFSPNMKEVVSVGIQHDMMVNVWNWKTGNKVASNKVSSKVSALAFSEDGRCFITVGNRHVRFWYLEDTKSKINQTVPLMGRSGILGNHKDNFFCDVVAGQGHLFEKFFVITQSGLLCEFNEKRQLNKWVELQTKIANCITAGQENIFVGCAEGVVIVFNATTLQFICSLPKPHHLGVEVTTATNPSHMVNKKEDARYPGTKAITIDDSHKKVTCIYNDRSVYTWDVHDVKRAGKVSSFLYHNGCIWALEMYPTLEDETKAMLPSGSFLTASADDTIRAWNLAAHMPENTVFKRNIYSNELLKIIYVDPSLTSLSSVNYNPAGGTDKTDTTYEGKNGVRSIRVSPDGADLASGDRQGNIRIYNMQDLSEKKCVEAHESDVMCLEYSYSQSGHFLATSSRDRLIHVFDVDENYGLVQSLGDHSSSITAVRFTEVDNKLQMISCGADKSILIRNAVSSPDFQFQLEHHLATKITLYDMVIDPTQKFLATACQDRNVRLYNIQTTKEKKCYRGTVGDEGVLLRIHLDPSGSYAATTGTDKNVCIVDFHTGELVASMYGHSEVVTGVKFANDLRHLITVSADGCIFVWRLPSDMTKHIKGKLQEMGKPVRETDKSDQSWMPGLMTFNNSKVEKSRHLTKSVSTGQIRLSDDCVFEDDANHTGLDINIGQLPNWAKVKFGETHSKAAGSNQEQSQPRGKWAQRADNSLEFKSQLDMTSLDDTFTEQFSTVESGFNTLPRIRRKTVTLFNRVENQNLPHVDDPPKSVVDVHNSLPTATKQLNDLGDISKSDSFEQYKSDTCLNNSAVNGNRWSERFALHKNNSVDDNDDLDTESDTTEIIYPPADSESDLFASTYKVYAVHDGKQKSRSRSIQGSVSVQDEVSTDNTSVEDEEDFTDEAVVISDPTSPTNPNKEFLPATPEKDEFSRETFVEDSFTPVPLVTVTRSLDSLTILDRKDNGDSVTGVYESTPFSPRLSLSARFMSLSQTPTSLKNSFPSLASYHQDSWFNKNKSKMVRAIKETRKSLLTMKLQNDSYDSDSLEKEDSPSPPIKLKEGVFTFPDAKEAKTLNCQPPTNAESNLKNNLPMSQAEINMYSLFKNSSPASSSLNNAVIENSKINCSNFQPNSTSECLIINNSANSTPNKRNIFKSSLENIQSDNCELTSQSDIFCDMFPAQFYKTKRLARKKLYASTPDLFDDVYGESEKTITKCTSASNLELLPMDVPEAASTKCISLVSEKPLTEKNQIDAKYLLDALNKRSISHTSQPLIEPSHVTEMSTLVSLKRASPEAGAGEIKERRKRTQVITLTQNSLSSEMFAHDVGVSRQSDKKSAKLGITLDQTRNKVSNSSSLQESSTNATDFVTGTSNLFKQFNSSEISNAFSTKNDNNQCKFGRDLTARCTAPLTMSNNIQKNVFSLEEEKQAYICNAISEFLLCHHESNFNNASPPDIPERDQPNKPLQQSSSSSSSLLHHPSQCLSINKTFQNSLSSPLSNECNYTRSDDIHANNVDNAYESCTKVYTDKNYKCTCMTYHDCNSPERQIVNGNAYSHNLPAISHNLSGSQQNRSVTQHSSGSSNADISRPNPSISLPGTKPIMTNKLENFTPGDNQLGLPSSVTVTPVSVTNCQALLHDFRTRLQTLTNLYSQVSMGTDEASLQVVTMLGDMFHETHGIIAELISTTSHQQQGTKGSSFLETYGCCDKTFQSSSPKSALDDSGLVKHSTSSSAHSDINKEPMGLMDKGAILLATKDMLQPIVSQLSQDISEGIWKLIKEAR